MATPEVIAAFTAFLGICLVAGWLTYFRDRSYVGWMGIAFIGLAGFLLALARLRQAEELGMANPQALLAARLLLLLWLAAFFAALISAVMETRRRLREIRASHQAAAEGLIEMLRKRAQEEKGDDPDTPGKN